MATEFVAVMREETVRELQRIRREISNLKQELNARFEFYKRVLEEKYLAMLAQLDEVVCAAEEQAEVTQANLTQLIRAKSEMLDAIRNNELNLTRENLSQELNEKIHNLTERVDLIPSVLIEWCDQDLESSIAGMCLLCKGAPYRNRRMPVYSGVRRGKRWMEVNEPASLSIDRENGDVFISDPKMSRITVFSKMCTYQRTIHIPEMCFPPYIPFFPNDITVTYQHLIVSCAPDFILKLDKKTGHFLSCVQTQYSISSVTNDADTLYAGMYDDNSIALYNLEDLSSINTILLHSPHNAQQSNLWNLSINRDFFVVLFEGCDNPLQLFARDGDFIRVIELEQLIDSRYFCLDTHLNLIVSDTGNHRVVVFSLDGEVVTTIGRRGTSPGEFYCPAGIDIDREGHIVVVDCKESLKLQFF